MTSFTILDHRQFRTDAPDLEMENINRDIEKTLSELPPMHTIEPQVIRDAREQGLGIWGPFKILDEVEERVIKGDGREVTVRIYTPDEVKGVYLHIHGGGFMLGRAHHYDEKVAMLADACGIAAVSVDYRLAPENPHPAGPDDCEAAAVWLMENMASEFGTDKLIIGGESAGANLSAVTLLRMRDKHDFKGYCGANLIYGIFDLTLTPSCRNWGERPLVLTTPLMKFFNNSYASEEKFTDPDVSPLYADLSDLCPALFTVGTLDPLLDDSLFMHSRWAAAGNRAELAVFPNAIHGFNAFPSRTAQTANDGIADFIKRAIEGY